MRLFRVVESETFPRHSVIQAPSGKCLRLTKLLNGKWVSYEDENKDCKVIVEALNFILTNSPEIIADWKETENAIS